MLNKTEAEVACCIEVVDIGNGDSVRGGFCHPQNWQQ